MKPATKKEKATEVEVQPLPYTQILRMVQVTFRCGVDVGGIEAWRFSRRQFNFKFGKKTEVWGR